MSYRFTMICWRSDCLFRSLSIVIVLFMGDRYQFLLLGSVAVTPFDLSVGVKVILVVF